MKNWMIGILVFLVVVQALPSQSVNGVGIGNAVASVSLCTVAPGAAVTLCPVSGDGLYLAVGSGSFSKIVTGTVTGGVTSVNSKTGVVNLGYSDLTSKPTSFKCATSDQSNTGLTASGCAIQ